MLVLVWHFIRYTLTITRLPLGKLKVGDSPMFLNKKVERVVSLGLPVCCLVNWQEMKLGWVGWIDR